jgi:alpha-glucuronidase
MATIELEHLDKAYAVQSGSGVLQVLHDFSLTVHDGATSLEQLDQLAENLSKIYTPETAEEVEDAIRAQLEEAAELGVVPEVSDEIFTALGS